MMTTGYLQVLQNNASEYWLHGSNGRRKTSFSLLPVSFPETVGGPTWGNRMLDWTNLNLIQQDLAYVNQEKWLSSLSEMQTKHAATGEDCSSQLSILALCRTGHFSRFSLLTPILKQISYLLSNKSIFIYGTELAAFFSKLIKAIMIPK